jgi:hypothetical protein
MQVYIYAPSRIRTHDCSMWAVGKKNALDRVTTLK